MPVVSITEARNEMMDHFLTAWNAQGTPPIVLYDDKDDNLPDNAPFARIFIRHSDGRIRTLGGIGSRRFRKTGLLTVQIFALSGKGLSTSDTFAKVVYDAFEGQNTGPDRVEFRNTRVNEIGQDGIWFQTNVITEFEYDEIK